jgi:membrane-bound ClpP family serine protease
VSHDAWASRVDRELLLSLDKKEIARQEVLNEIIYSEEKFLSDLTILREASQNTKKKIFFTNPQNRSLYKDWNDRMRLKLID